MPVYRQQTDFFKAVNPNQVKFEKKNLPRSIKRAGNLSTIKLTMTIWKYVFSNTI